MLENTWQDCYYVIVLCYNRGRSVAFLQHARWRSLACFFSLALACSARSSLVPSSLAPLARLSVIPEKWSPVDRTGLIMVRFNQPSTNQLSLSISRRGLFILSSHSLGSKLLFDEITTIIAQSSNIIKTFICNKVLYNTWQRSTDSL